MGARQAAGGGRWVEVSPTRLERWLAGFVERHGGITESVTASTTKATTEGTPQGSTKATAKGTPEHGDRHDGTQPGGLLLTGADGDTAEFHLTIGTASTVDDLLAAATASYRFGLILARRGGFAVGVAEGDRLLVSKVDSTYVQGRTAAGGWSQQRFARRRARQAQQAWSAAADAAARVLLPQLPLSALVCGGDRRAIDEILADPRLAPVAAVRAERFLDVAEPRLAVLKQAVLQARAVRIVLRP